MNKELIKKEIERIQQGIIDDLNESRQRNATAADIDENEPIDPEDLSRQNELGTMATRLKFMLEKAQSDLDHLHNISLDPVGEVQEGALVTTDLYVFYIGIAVHPFDMQDKHIVSISQDAPIFMAMRGKKAGDAFQLANRNYHILSVE